MKILKKMKEMITRLTKRLSTPSAVIKGSHPKSASTRSNRITTGRGQSSIRDDLIRQNLSLYGNAIPRVWPDGKLPLGSDLNILGFREKLKKSKNI